MTRREPYAWDRSGPRDPFVAEMEALLGAFDVRASAAEGVAIADEVAARREPAMPRSRDAFAIGFAAAAAAVLLVLALVAPHSVQPVDPATPGLQMPDMPAPTVQQPQVAIPIEAPALPEDRVAVKDRIVFERSVEADERVVVEEPASLEASIEAEVPRKLSRKPKSRQSAPTPNDDMAPFVAALGKRMPEVDRCVEQARERNPDLRGYFWLAFSVAPSGVTTNVAVIPRNNLRDPVLFACVVGVVKLWTFDEASRPRDDGNQARIPIYLEKD